MTGLPANVRPGSMAARMFEIQAEWERSERLDLETPVEERCQGSLRETGAAELDPSWEWTEVRRMCDVAPTYVKGRCRHLDVVPVEAGGEVVAHLCLTCDHQLP